MESSNIYVDVFLNLYTIVNYPALTLAQIVVEYNLPSSNPIW